MIFFFLFLLIFLYLAVEKFLHEKRLERIPIRIHVNGTRGKSAVTRLIADSLRRAGIRTLAKTTGTIPRLILPDGKEEMIPRRGPARILEQIHFIRRAAELQAEAVVVECMAIDPALQFASETRMIRSTIGVITNVRPDHLETMGETLDEIAESLSRTIPVGGALVTADRRYYPFFRAIAGKVHTEAFLVDSADPRFSASLPSSLLFPENIAIAEKICSLLRLAPAFVSTCFHDDALVRESAGIFRVTIGGKRISFIDAFSANDIASTRIIQERAASQAACPKPWVALFNNRADRPLRLCSFADTLLGESLYDCIALTGESQDLARRYLRRKIPSGRVWALGNRSPAELLDELLQKVPVPELTIVGLGNDKGPGRLLAQLFRGASPQ
jgi:poly-gamma-glutamate synthase PgsB/CapB